MSGLLITYIPSDAETWGVIQRAFHRDPPFLRRWLQTWVSQGHAHVQKYDLCHLSAELQDGKFVIVAVTADA